MNEKKGTLIVLSGPSGVGKSTLISEFLEKRKDIFFSVSYTTRDPRPTDIPGKTYNFVSKEEFERMIRDGELLEYAMYVDNYYGTSMKVIRDHLDVGTDVLLDIEVQGAEKVKSLCPDCVRLFIYPPSLEELERRLRGRNTDSEDAIQGRLRAAVEECAKAGGYDYLVVNDDLHVAVDELVCVLKAESLKTKNREELIERMRAHLV